MNWKDGEKLNGLNDLFEIEKNWSTKLPLLFREIINRNNKAYPNKNIFDTNISKGRVFGGFLNFDLSNTPNVLSDYSMLKGKLPNMIFPFAEDPSGNFICFDYQSNKDIPSIILWNHEGIINRDNKEVYLIENIAANFDDFLLCLYEEEDDELDFSEFETL